jgi:hypothetical protein
MSSLPPSASGARYRARTVLEIVDAAVQLVRRHFGQFVTLSLMMYLPTTAILVGIPLSEHAPDGASDGALIALLAAVIVFALAFAGWILIVDTALALAAADAYHARPVAAGAALRAALGRGGPVIRAGILKGLVLGLVILGPIAVSALSLVGGRGSSAVTALLPIAGLAAYVYLYASYFAVPAIAALEPVGAVEALSRSRALARDNVLRIAGALFLTWILFCIGYVVAAVIGGIVPGVPDWVASMAATACIFPLVPTVSTVLYYDLRIRNEGYDLAMMSESLDAAA